MIISSVSNEFVNSEGARHIDEVSKALEATFISEMLKSIEPDGESSQFGGGIGEGQFKSFLTEQRASAIVGAGGFGLAEHFARSLGAK